MDWTGTLGSALSDDVVTALSGGTLFVAWSTPASEGSEDRNLWGSWLNLSEPTINEPVSLAEETVASQRSPAVAWTGGDRLLLT